MVNRLSTAISPYLRSHADNPVDWFPWGDEAFAEARRRDVPVLVSIGYSTCHWCHVMARESFSDPALAAELNARFVAVKVDREEYPEVDSVYLAAAGAFTQNLGWPLNVFVTPEGRAFYAGTYSPPVPVQGNPSFRQILDAVADAWSTRRDQVDETVSAVASALASAQETAPGRSLPDDLGAELDRLADALGGYEDRTHGGFGGAPKFPVAPVLLFLVNRGHPLGARTLRILAASPLRDPVEGGFFRYAVNRDWSEPHYERMLYDNAQLLDAYARVAAKDADAAWARDTADGVASFLLRVLRRSEGGFASAQDSESTVAGVCTEGGYYALDAASRGAETPPAVDGKVLTGWNGLAIAALARAGFALDRPDWTAAAEAAATFLLENHVTSDGLLRRASIEAAASSAPATLEDYGMFARGLLALATSTGSVRYAVVARELVDAVLDAGFAAPGGGDPVLTRQGLSIPVDPSEGAYPSGLSALSDAAITLFELTGDRRYREAAIGALSGVLSEALQRPIAYGASLDALARLAEVQEQLVVVTPGPAADRAADPLVRTARSRDRGLVLVLGEVEAAELAAAGFELLAGRSAVGGVSTAYLCHDFVCRLPLTDADALRGLLAQ